MQTLKDLSIQYIKGVGPARKKLFAQLGIESVEDLFYFFPRRYEDRTQMTKISDIKVGEWYTLSGKVMALGGRKTWFTRKHVYETIVEDSGSRIYCVWFNQPYLEYYFKPGCQVVIYGKVEIYKDRLQMVAPEYEIIDENDKDNLNIGRIVPIYPLTRGLSQRYLRKIIKSACDGYLKEQPDFLPVALRNKYRLFNIKRSLFNLHFPDSFKMQEESHRRISFEEFFFFQLSVLLRRMSITSKPGIAHTIDPKSVEQFVQSFSFELTRSQKKVIGEIVQDMQKSAPMLRLLQGDVGSGKTLVALFGCVMAYKNKCQSAIMAPTEILARQHYQVISEILKDSPFKNMRVALLLGGFKKKDRDQILVDVKNGDIDLLIGTHALLNEQVEFKKLSYVVIDEQHKFGVKQRALLAGKGTNPDVLIMTATPIPRTLCLTLYGDLDLSVIDELPEGRGKIETRFFTSDHEREVYSLIRERIKKGQQAYVIYPIIHESDKVELKAAQTMYKHFKSEEFKDFKVGLVHGQMDRAEADVVMAQFKNRELDVLVATTIIEVGVDVPNANVMLIEHAERFGLSQLHQLRGRIGRGSSDALCLLVAQPTTSDAIQRMEAIVSSTDGFKIAQQDLNIRGPGQFFGRHQHGLNELRFADPTTEIDLLELARQEAAGIIDSDPKFAAEGNVLLKKVIQNRYPQYLSMVGAG